MRQQHIDGIDARSNPLRYVTAAAQRATAAILKHAVRVRPAAPHRH
jgi:hypothetical protein